MELHKWISLLLPEQVEFFRQNMGVGITPLLDDQLLEFEYDLDDGFFVFCEGSFIINEQDTDWQAYAAEQEANGVARVVLLDGRGDVLYVTGANKVAPPEEWIDTPRDVKYHGLDILDVMISRHLFSLIEPLASSAIVNEDQSKEGHVLSLSAWILRENPEHLGLPEEEKAFADWLRWKVQMLPAINEVRIAVWS
jgi:hypothetical protein